MKQLKIKVCGITKKMNNEEIANLPIDYIGLNFYKPSPRYVSVRSDFEFGDQIKKAGVFVNADLNEIKERISDYNLDAVQLHGEEDVEFCKTTAQFAALIKVFRVTDSFNFSVCEKYENVCKYFLFDTHTKNFGGSGKKFNWKILNQYNGETPFFLSGGIGFEDAKHLREINHSKFIGVDINSKFETEPGNKDIGLIKTFAQKLNRNDTNRF